ncbi:MAG: hypothetical protein AAB544_04030, partial [Patescibacteria group bacterium]
MVSTFFGAKKVEKETSVAGGKVAYDSPLAERKMRPHPHSSPRIFARSAHGMRDGAFPMRPDPVLQEGRKFIR